MGYFVIFLGLLPSVAWLVFYLREDPHPEPKKLILMTFALGALSTLFVLACQSIINNWMVLRGVAEHTFPSFLVLAVIEEIFKFTAAYAVIRYHQEDFDEPVDAMIYPVVAALGFATVENIAAAFNAQGVALETTALRFIGATLLHTLCSGLIGYYWAKSIFKNKVGFLAFGFAAAIVLHAAFNSLIINFRPEVIPTFFLINLALIVLYDFDKLKNIK